MAWCAVLIVASLVAGAALMATYIRVVEGARPPWPWQRRRRHAWWRGRERGIAEGRAQVLHEIAAAGRQIRNATDQHLTRDDPENTP